MRLIVFSFLGIIPLLPIFVTCSPKTDRNLYNRGSVYKISRGKWEGVKFGEGQMEFS